MSIATQITRINNLVSQLRTNIQNKGVELSNDADLSDCVSAVNDISGDAPIPVWPENEYFTITNLSESSCDIYLIHNQTTTSAKINVSYDYECSSDKITWTRISGSNTLLNTYFTSIEAGSTIYLRSRLRDFQYKASSNNIYENYKYFSFTNNVSLSGNIMSLIYGDNFIGQKVVPPSFLKELFKNCTTITDIHNLYLNIDEILKDGCYGMFNGCTGITNLPIFNVNNVYERGCYQMFYNCSNLTSTYINQFKLSATILNKQCYALMFTGCTSLTTAPELPATILAERCYNSMFNNCTSLTSAPALPVTTLADYCYYLMFSGCSSLTTAPELSATTLVESCYGYMFRNCTSLNYIKCLATDISATNCTSNWVSGVASSGTFVKDSSMNNWTIDINGIPVDWTVENAS